jgi:hypothetical protein
MLSEESEEELAWTNKQQNGTYSNWSKKQPLPKRHWGDSFPLLKFFGKNALGIENKPTKASEAAFWKKLMRWWMLSIIRMTTIWKKSWEMYYSR